MPNYSSIARSCIGPGGAPYSRMHINDVMNGRRNCSKALADQLVAIGVIKRRCLRVSSH